MAASGTNVKADKRCTASESRSRITDKHSEPVKFCGLLAMRWAKLVLYLYIAQAAVGTAIGLALPLLHAIAG
jgi:hypothetical protein